MSVLYKIGDKVKVRNDLTLKLYEGVNFSKSMCKYMDEVVTICDVRVSNGVTKYSIKEDDKIFTWTGEMFEKPITTQTTKKGEDIVTKYNVAARDNLIDYLMTYNEVTLSKIYKFLCYHLKHSDGELSGLHKRHISNKICDIFTKLIENDEFDFDKVSWTIRRCFGQHNLRDEYKINFINEVKKLTNPNYNIKGENNMNTNKLFDQFMPEVAKNGDFAITMSGKLAIKRPNGDYVRYIEETGAIENQMDFVFGGDELSGMVYLIPTAIKDIKKGDILRFDDKNYIAVLSVDDGKVKYTNLITDAIGSLAKETNVLIGNKLYKKVVSMFDFCGTNEAVNGFNPMLFMLMGNKDGKDNDFMKIMAMSSMMGGNATATFGGINPMMFMFMGDKGGSGDLMKFMAMSAMMGGNGTNPFAGLMGAVNATTETE